MKTSLHVPCLLLFAALLSPVDAVAAVADKPAQSEPLKAKSQTLLTNAAGDQASNSPEAPLAIQAALAIEAARHHAEGIEAVAKANKEYYETFSQIVAGLAAVLLFVLGFIGYSERKERTELDVRIRDAKRQLDTHVEAAEKTRKTVEAEIARLAAKESGLNVWILDLNRAMNTYVVAVLMDDKGNHGIIRRHYLKAASEILEKIVLDPDPKIEDSIRAFGYRNLAGVYKRMERNEDAWRAMQKALALTSQERDSFLLYNAACCACVNGLREQGFEFLEAALVAEPGLVELVRIDEDFKALYGDARFEVLIRPAGAQETAPPDEATT